MLGIDLLGLAHPKFPFKMVLNQLALIDKPFSVGAFAWGVFGTRRMFVRRLAAICELKRCRLVRIQAYWDDNKTRPPLDERLVRIPFLKIVAKVTQDFAETYPRKTFCLSHTCEYYSKNRTAIQKRNDVIREIAPKVLTVNSPIGGVHVGADILERHGDIRMPAGQGVSLDGKDAKDVKDLRGWISKNSHCKYTLLWVHSMNLRIKGKTPPPRPERDVRVTKAEMEWLRSFF